MNLLELLLCLYICISVCLGAVLEHEPSVTVVMSVYLYVKVLYLNMNLVYLLLCLYICMLRCFTWTWTCWNCCCLYICMSVCLGAVLEHEPAGTVVMSVSAIDGDGTYPNNRNIVQFINSITNSFIYLFIFYPSILLFFHFSYSFFLKKKL